MSNYPDGLSPQAYCHMEGCLGNGHCSRCGETNYHLLGYFGAVAKWAKIWNISLQEAERRIEASQLRQGAPRIDAAPRKDA